VPVLVLVLRLMRLQVLVLMQVLVQVLVLPPVLVLLLVLVQLLLLPRGQIMGQLPLGQIMVLA